ncbi:MAG: competence/damage-inducible protein A [Sphingobacterium sp.]
MKAEIITIGDEILLGQTVDTNSAWIAQRLAEHQIYAEQITSITDTQEHILQALDHAAKRADLIICTGGLGPTRDDITKQSAALYFGSSLVFNQEVMDHVKNIFSRFSRPMPTVNNTQANVLSNAEILFNDWGTAPGMWVEHEDKIYVFLPGVPFEMKHLLASRVLPRLSGLTTTELVAIRYLLVIGLGESYLAEQIAEIEDTMPRYAHLAYLPQIGLIKLRITVSGNDGEQLEREADNWRDRLSLRIGPAVVGTEDVDFAEIIIRAFAASACTLSAAESCTGGQIAARITAVSGASAIFQGGIVAYANAIKHQLLGVRSTTLEEHGAVSKEAVIEMAIGAQEKLRTTYAIATSGIAGPTGGSPEKPIGTVWIAVAGKNEVCAKNFLFADDRAVNIERTVSQALLMLWDLFQKEKLH